MAALEIGSGLFVIIAGVQHPVGLANVRVGAQMIDCASEITILQTYYNASTVEATEATYFFPLDEQAAVCEFEARINGKVIVGQVTEKERAKHEYAEAVQRGDGAYLVEQHKCVATPVGLSDTTSQPCTNPQCAIPHRITQHNPQVGVCVITYWPQEVPAAERYLPSFCSTTQHSTALHHTAPHCTVGANG